MEQRTNEQISDFPIVYDRMAPLPKQKSLHACYLRLHQGLCCTPGREGGGWR